MNRSSRTRALGFGAALASFAALALGLGCQSAPPPKPRTTHDALMPEPEAPAAPARATGPDEGPEVSTDGSPHSGVAVATLPGFRTFEDGHSRAFVDISEHVALTELDGTVKVDIRLKGVRVPDRVNRMDMPSSFFGRSPVARVHLMQVGDDAAFIIDLRQPVHPKTSVHRTGFGTRVVVEFPPLTPAEQDPHYRKQDDVRFGFDVMHQHSPYGEENRRLVHDHEGMLHSNQSTSLSDPQAVR